MTLGLAGCLGDDGESSNPSPQNGTGTATGTPVGTTGGGNPNGTESTPSEPTETATPDDLGWAKNRGTLIDTFADFEKKWTVVDGKAKKSSRTAFSGKESVLMDTSGANRVIVSRRFETSKDFRNHSLSLAVQPVDSTTGRVTVNVQFHGLFGGMRTVSGTVDTRAGGKWVRFDMGVADEDGANMRAIKELRIYCYDGEDDSTKFYVDDLRIVKKPRKGAVMFAFEGGSPADYNVAYRTLKQFGWAGTMFTPTSDINQGGEGPTVKQYKEMLNNGWVIGGHTVGPEKLTDLSEGDQEIVFAENRRQLDEMGLSGDFVPFAPPYGSYNAATLDLVLRKFDSMYVDAGRASGAAVPVTDPRTIPLVNGEELEEAKGSVDDAANYRQLAAFIIDPGEVKPAQLKQLCQHVKQQVAAGNLQVLNTDQHYQQYVATSNSKSKN